MPRKKAKSRRRRADLPRPDHWPPLEREQHGGGTVEEGREVSAGGIATVRGRRAAAECMLDLYRNRRHIDEREWEAGMRIRETGARAALGSSVTGSYGERVPGRPEMSDASVRAREGLRMALLELGEAERAVILSVCLYDEPAGKRLPLLRVALDALAHFFRLPDR